MRALIDVLAPYPGLALVIVFAAALPVPVADLRGWVRWRTDLGHITAQPTPLPPRDAEPPLV